MKLDRCLEIATSVIMIALIIGVIFAVCIPFYMFFQTCQDLAETNAKLETAIANGYEIFPTADDKLHKELADNMIANLQALSKAVEKP